MKSVWNEKNIANISNYLADEYIVHIDNADPWEGKTLNRNEFETRLILLCQLRNYQENLQ